MTQPAPAKLLYLTHNAGQTVLNIQERDGEHPRQWLVDREQLFHLNEASAKALTSELRK